MQLTEAEDRGSRVPKVRPNPHKVGMAMSYKWPVHPKRTLRSGRRVYAEKSGPVHTIKYGITHSPIHATITTRGLEQV